MRVGKEEIACEQLKHHYWGPSLPSFVRVGKEEIACEQLKLLDTMVCENPMQVGKEEIACEQLKRMP